MALLNNELVCHIWESNKTFYSLQITNNSTETNGPPVSLLFHDSIIAIMVVQTVHGSITVVGKTCVGFTTIARLLHNSIAMF